MTDVILFGNIFMNYPFLKSKQRKAELTKYKTAYLQIYRDYGVSYNEVCYLNAKHISIFSVRLSNAIPL